MREIPGQAQYQALNDDEILLHISRARAAGRPPVLALREKQDREAAGTWAPDTSMEGWAWSDEFSRKQAQRLGRSEDWARREVEQWARAMTRDQGVRR
ncbi:hypothetical protein [Amycolatopsis sp. VC5-11]|uniref:hypothetical protein n=1 Tax=Amycolatopsis sp. VC5-11 TaxID=3120156 RepID=UPI00300A8466